VNKRKRDQGKQEELPLLKDRLNDELLMKLKEKKEELIRQEERRKAEEEARKREEARRREREKTFAQLLDESDLDWRQFK
jgi:hypothetical protein